VLAETHAAIVVKPPAFLLQSKLRLTSPQKPEDFPSFSRPGDLEVFKRQAHALPSHSMEKETDLMAGKKKYTNATFTKRVDHEAGRHRPSRAMSEPAVCSGCGAVFANRRWTATNSGSGNRRDKFRPPQLTVCPACQQQRTGEPRGFVYLDGAFFVTHQEEIERLLRNEVARAAEDNPLARIMEWNRGNDHKLTITTTTEHLAQRLGHALEKAFAGIVKYHFSHENKLARVNWQRE